MDEYFVMAFALGHYHSLLDVHAAENGRRGMGGNSFSKFGKSTAKVSEKGTKSSVTFSNVAGLKEAKTDSMVAYYGLDKEIGPISFYESTGRNQQMLGKPYSENMAEQIDWEVQNQVNTAYERTKDLLIEHRDELEKLAQLLLKQEVVEKEDLVEILGERTVEELEKRTEKVEL